MTTSDPNSELLTVQAGPIKVASADVFHEPGQASIIITFFDNTVLHASFWRLIANGKATLSSFDHKQQYGLPAPIDAIANLQKDLDGRLLTALSLNKVTGDLLLCIEGEGEKLQVFNFSGYEIWTIRYPDGTRDFSNYVLE
ncbi:MAG TPA: hypothetical protein V6C76_18110 [Drouetiella sp.]